MIVKYITDLNVQKERNYCQIPNKEYLVYSIFTSSHDNLVHYNLYDDEHMKKLTAVNAALYQIIDNRIPSDWLFTLSRNKFFHIIPQKFLDACNGNFEEHYYNFDPNAEPIIERVINKDYEYELEAQAIFEEVTRDLETFHNIKPENKKK